MTALYAGALALGIVGILAWIAHVAITMGSDLPPPKTHVGATVGALVGFGMAGMSASFAGGNTVVSFVGAIIGGGALWLLGTRLGVDTS
ncbi:MAG: hypothetical protein IIC71_13725 [Acidobacteria bacterium]|nr:hypothetical protein [Acidobacteriota bacterium]